LPGGEEGTVPRRSVVGYVAAQREHCTPVSHREKSGCWTSWERWPASSKAGPAPPSRPGRPREYNPAVAAQLVRAAAGQIGRGGNSCSSRRFTFGPSPTATTPSPGFWRWCWSLTGA